MSLLPHRARGAFGSRPAEPSALACMGGMAIGQAEEAPMWIVDPWHWLEPDGSLPTNNPKLRRQALRVARIIEYGAELEPGELRLTLVECRRRPGGRPCPGFLLVGKFANGELEAGCPSCGEADMRVHNWEDTLWGIGIPPPLPSEPFAGPDP